MNTRTDSTNKTVIIKKRFYILESFPGLYFPKPVYGFKKDPETDQTCQEENYSDHVAKILKQ